MRFSVCTFWPSFVSITCSVGTTTRRKRVCWFIESIRCSRFVLTLFSCPEYVLIAYHLNMREPLLPEEDVLDEPLECQVGEPEVRAYDHAGDQHDGGALDQLLLSGPLDLLQLGGGLADEAAEARARDLALGCDGSGLGRTHLRGPRARIGAVPLLSLLLRAAGAS